MKPGDRIIVAALAVLGAAYYLTYYNYGINLLDEGNLVEPAMRVLSGEVPYRDFHHVYAPGRFYVLAFLFRLFGPGLLVERLFWVPVHIAAAVAAYAALRKSAGTPYAVMAALAVTLCPGPWHKGLLVLFSLLTPLVLFVFAERPGAKTAFAAGAWAALVTIFRQDFGAYAVAAFLALTAWITLVEKDRGLIKRSAFFGAGFAACIAPALAYFAYRCNLHDVYFDLFRRGMGGVEANSLPFPPFLPLFKGGIWETLRVKLFYLPLAVHAAALAALGWTAVTGRKGGSGRMLAALTVMGAFTLLQIKNRTDTPHLYQVLPITLVILFTLLSMAASHRPAGSAAFRRWAGLALCVLATVWVCGVGLVFYGTGSINIRNANYRLLGIDRARVYVPPALADSLEAVVRDVDGMTVKGRDNMAAVPDIPMVYFLADRRNPLGFHLLRAGMNSSDAAQREIVDSFEQKDVKLVVLHTNEAHDNRPERRFSVHSPIIYSYIRDNFAKTATYGDFEILVRDAASRRAESAKGPDAR